MCVGSVDNQELIKCPTLYAGLEKSRQELSTSMRTARATNASERIAC